MAAEVNAQRPDSSSAKEMSARAATIRGSTTAAQQTEPPTPDRPFSLTLSMPLFFTSNAETVSAGGTGTLEGNPELRLEYKQRLGQSRIQIRANGDLGVDRYERSNGGDQDAAAGGLRILYIDPDDDQAFAPFVEYAPKYLFDPTFSRVAERRHNIAFGFEKSFNFDGAFSPVAPRPDTSSDTVWALGFSAKLQRRFDDLVPSSYAVYLTPSATWSISDRWNVNCETNLVRRFHDVAAGQHRRDWRLQHARSVQSARYGSPACLSAANERPGSHVAFRHRP